MRTFTYVCKIYIYVKFTYVCKSANVNFTIVGVAQMFQFKMLGMYVLNKILVRKIAFGIHINLLSFI